MNAYRKETTFLRELIVYDDSTERQKLEERITEIHRNECCVRSAVWLMIFLIVLAIAGLGHSAVFLKDFPDSKSHFVIKFSCVLGLGSMISLLGYLGFWMFYRHELDRQYEECRRLVAKQLESRLGEPRTWPLPEAVQELESPGSTGVDNTRSQINNGA